MFVDHIIVHAKAGDGGNGSPSFRRAKFEPKGGPDGGDGGKGGDIVLEVSPHTDSLREFFYKSKVKAKAGDNGGAQQRTGRSGKDLVLTVPAGTLVYRQSEGLDPETGAPGRELIADLTEIGERFVMAKGGAGGKGNVHFKNSRNQAPSETTPGEDGEEADFFLELRRIADCGLVGLPNAGKSTLLGKLSAAQPKVAAYPFTTLQPMVGVLEFEGFSRCTVADIPGLIEGAHANRGLGHEFLRHIMRCRLLLFVIDMAGSEERDPIEDLMGLREEISLHDEILAQKPWLVIANKMDLPGAEENLKRFAARFPKTEILEISALEGQGIEALKAKLDAVAGHRPA